MSGLPPAATLDDERLSPERLSAIATSPEGRQMLLAQREKLLALRAEYAKQSAAQINSFDEGLSRIDTALSGGEIAV